MSMVKPLAAGIAATLALALALLAAGSAGAADLPGLGKPVSEAELAMWDMSIARTARDCRRAAALPPKAPSSSRRSAKAVTARTAQAALAPC